MVNFVVEKQERLRIIMSSRSSIEPEVSIHNIKIISDRY